MTGAISFSGVSVEEARAEKRVFLRTLAILLGVDEAWVRVAIRRARRATRRRLDASYLPTRAPKTDMPTLAPILRPTATTALEPTATALLEPTTASEGVSVDYNVSVPSISDAEAVAAVVETTTPEDVDAAIEVAATEVAEETDSTITLVESLVTTEISAVETVADPPGDGLGDDTTTDGLSEADDSGGGGGGGGADTAAVGGAAAGALLLLAFGGLYFYRRRKASAAAEERVPSDIEVPRALVFKPVEPTPPSSPSPPPRSPSPRHAVPPPVRPGLLRHLSSWSAEDAPLAELAPDGVAAWLRRQNPPGDVEGLCAAVISKGVTGTTLRDADDADLRDLGVATLGLRKAVLKLTRAEPSARRGYHPAKSADAPPTPPPPPARPGLLGRLASWRSTE